MSWSADGKRLIVTGASNAGVCVLATMDLSGRAHVLLESKTWFYYPRPSPDGKRIAYMQNVSESNVTLLEHF